MALLPSPEPGNPTWNPRAVLPVGPTELTRKRWLLVEYDEQMEADEHERGVRQKNCSLGPKEVTEQDDHAGDVHGVANKPVQASYHELSGWIDRCRGAATLNHEIAHAPKQSSGTQEQARKAKEAELPERRERRGRSREPEWQVEEERSGENNEKDRCAHPEHRDNRRRPNPLVSGGPARWSSMVRRVPPVRSTLS